MDDGKDAPEGSSTSSSHISSFLSRVNPYKELLAIFVSLLFGTVWLRETFATKEQLAEAKCLMAENNNRNRAQLILAISTPEEKRLREQLVLAEQRKASLGQSAGYLEEVAVKVASEEYEALKQRRDNASKEIDAVDKKFQQGGCAGQK